jgi:hypothetical protein
LCVQCDAVVVGAQQRVAGSATDALRRWARASIAGGCSVRGEAQHVPLGSLLTVGRGLALSDVQIEHVALLVVGRVVEGEGSDFHSHGVHPGGSLRLP